MALQTFPDLNQEELSEEPNLQDLLWFAAIEKLVLNELICCYFAEERFFSPFVLQSKDNIDTTTSWLTILSAQNQSHIH